METVFIALRVALSLGVVLGLLWVIQRRLSSTGRAKRSAGVVNVITRQGISPKASVVVVDVDGTRFLLGVTDSSVTVLHSADAPAEEAGLALAPVAELTNTTTSTATASAFASSLSAAAAAAAAAPVAVAPATTAPAFDDDAAYRRPRNRDRMPSSALEGSVLSAATWRQAGAALRQRRAG